MKIDRGRPLHEQVYHRLWDMIFGGQLAPGQRLSDVDVAARLSVSRTPVREAIRKLEQDGILLPLTHGGYELRVIPPEELQSLYRCRAVLEALAVREAGPHFTLADAERMRRLIERLDSLILRREFDSAFELNTTFHEQIAELTNNPYLTRLLQNLQRLILYARSTFRHALASDPGLVDVYVAHLQRRQGDHRQIVELLARQEVDAAAAAMEAHLFGTAEDMLTILQSCRTTRSATEDTERAIERP